MKTFSMKRGVVGSLAALLLAVGGIAVAASPAAAAPTAAALTPSCNSYHQYDLGDGTHYRLPSVGWGGTIECHLSRGNRNDGVKVLQYLIACNGRAELPDGTFVERDGDFGSITERALVLVQQDKHITDDGVYGAQTRRATAWPIFRNDGIFVDCY
jgi:peptidoglycan hydrolase-like protein with peptidoglycan-binding domain